MSEPNSSNIPTPSRSGKLTNRSFIDRLSAFISRAPEDRDDLKALLASAHERGLLDAEALAMIEGVLQVSERTAGEVMVLRSKMDVIDITDSIDKVLATVISSGHSRFPVISHDRDQIVGILLAKDLVRYAVDRSLDLHALLRPAVFIPESKRLDILLREFRANRNHLAMIVDEHGGIAGLITIEDVLEQIVGSIEDEFDNSQIEQHILSDEANRWRVMADIPISEFNQAFATELDDSEYETMAGWVSGCLGRVPRRGDRAVIDGLDIDVIRADARRAQWFRVTRRVNPDTSADPLEK